MSSSAARPRLGLLRAIPSLMRVGFAEAVAYRAEFLVWILATNMPLIMLLLWSAVAKEAPVGRFGEAEFGAYFLATLIVRLVTSSWVIWDLNFEIRQGTIGMRLLRPLHPFVWYAAENLAALPMRAMVALPVAAIALLWLGAGQLNPDPVAWAIVPVALIGAWAMTFCAMAMIGSLGLLWESSLSVFQLWLGLYFVIGGYVLPLELLPDWLYAVVRWLPFRYLLSFPVETMLGLIDRREALGALAVQWGYAALFLAGALAVWRRGLARYSAFGG
ncbi:ABC transporter permease [Vulgatibacter incomptus]|uniref:ABC transporter permease n=1 Tax=Vulgatibacter incomptus TaxID=1391653 RepID=A0A0K1PEX1_9BACT|nr:ABC-2 family transporter protein [Vulgatibacter incomptus]AKU92052.1 hypothetical protein AKJ08_2439 [Vulgatibacter incomptus]